MIVPGVIFGGLYAVPLIERRLTGDDRDHHLLDRPRDAPNRTAIGLASVAFVTILFLGGAQDVIATTLSISVGHVTTFLQIALLVVPPITFVVSRRACRSLRDRPGPERTERRVPIARTASGGYAIPDADAEDWMLAGGAAPGHFDEITEHGAVRGAGSRKSHENGRDDGRDADNGRAGDDGEPTSTQVVDTEAEISAESQGTLR